MMEICETIGELPAGYAEIPIAFEVRSVFEPVPVDRGIGGITLREVAVGESYIKDYDGTADGGPDRWADRFNIASWCFITAEVNGHLVGGGAVGVGNRSLGAPEGRADVAVLWDIRVQPDRRGAGVGKSIFEAAAEWARRGGCVQIQAETQNVNVGACKFYAKLGCELATIDRYAYWADWAAPETRDEVMLKWVLAF